MSILKKRVRVTWADIKRARCGDPVNCAVAHALKRQSKKVGWCVNSADDITSPNNVIYSVCSRDFYKVNNFIGDFDSGHKVRPISFDIVRV